VLTRQLPVRTDRHVVLIARPRVGKEKIHAPDAAEWVVHSISQSYLDGVVARPTNGEVHHVRPHGGVLAGERRRLSKEGTGVSAAVGVARIEPVPRKIRDVRV